MSRHYVLGVAGTGGRIVGVILAGVPLAGLSGTSSWSLYELGTAAPFVLLGLLLATGSRGVTPDVNQGRILVWYGLTLTRWLVVPAWRRHEYLTDLDRVCVRGYDPGGSFGPSKGWTVLLIPKRGYEHAIAVSRYLLFRNAERAARALAHDVGLPLE